MTNRSSNILVYCSISVNSALFQGNCNPLYITAMAYRISSLLALAVILFTSPFLRAANATPQNRISCIKDIVTIVGGGGIVDVGATLWKLVTNYEWEDKNTVYSDLPRMPSNHLFQPRAEEIRELEEKFNTLEKANPGDIVVTVYITGDPASGKTQLAGQFGRDFTSPKTKIYLLEHWLLTANLDFCRNIFR